MPVRDALNRLTVERALETLPSRTVRVPAVSKDALQDLRETRFAIEGLAISRAAANVAPESLDLLRSLNLRSERRTEPGVSLRDLSTVRIRCSDAHHRKSVAARGMRGKD